MFKLQLYAKLNHDQSIVLEIQILVKVVFPAMKWDISLPEIGHDRTKKQTILSVTDLWRWSWLRSLVG